MSRARLGIGRSQSVQTVLPVEEFSDYKLECERTGTDISKKTRELIRRWMRAQQRLARMRTP